MIRRVFILLLTASTLACVAASVIGYVAPRDVGIPPFGGHSITLRFVSWSKLGVTHAYHVDASLPWSDWSWSVGTQIELDRRLTHRGTTWRTGVSEWLVSLWIPFAGSAIYPFATLVLWWRRRPPPGHCQDCGYDLTGNVSGVCPECGTGVDPGAPAKGEKEPE